VTVRMCLRVKEREITKYGTHTQSKACITPIVRERQKSRKPNKELDTQTKKKTL